MYGQDSREYFSNQQQGNQGLTAWLFWGLSPTIARHVASRTDAASTDHRLDHGDQAIVLPVGADAGHSRATGRGTSDPRREDRRARQDKEVHPGPISLSGLRFCLSRPQASDEPKPLPAMSKRSHRNTALWHRASQCMIWSAGQQCVKPVGWARKGPL